ncbi:copper homeostasis periplasmic binding protein CopC [Rhizobium sp. BK251]|uniref:copper homeostasis periplasmic binding protein CopC n=1 Tax=Rhizobium sp. BK251 TaxID=2512125 RepID=UPI0010508CBC|nr:copper homeostasis periplasmic binding protein CopC [Rhizobium sp. BK251]TCL75983.1 hypothetical protein EV286_101529 [Rhizobium sp. BK251]
MRIVPSFSMLLTAVLVGVAGPAMAHAHLQSAEPAADTSVASAPGSLSLTFSEGLNLPFSGVDLTDAKGAAVETGKASLSGADGTVLTVPLDTSLTAGSYKVHWHVLSNDGHKTEGNYSFTVKP